MKKLLFLAGLLFCCLAVKPVMAAIPLSEQDKAAVIQEEWGNIIQGEMEVPTIPQKPSKPAVLPPSLPPAVTQPAAAPLPVNPAEIIRPAIIQKEGKPKIVLEEPDFLKKSISLNVGAVPLRFVLTELAAQAAVPIITQEGVDPTSITQGYFQEKPLKEVLDDICQLQNYDWEAREGKIYVSRFSTRILRFPVPNMTTSFSAGVTTTGLSTENQANTVQNTANTATSTTGTSGSTASTSAGPSATVKMYTDSTSVFKEIETNLKGLVSKDGFFALNATTGTAIIHDTAENTRRLEMYFSVISAELGRQVAVKAKIVEVTLSSGFQAGINWDLLFDQGSFQSAFDLVTTGNVLVLRNKEDPLTGTSTNGLSAAVNLLATEGKINILSEPSLTVMNGSPAIIQVADIISYIASVEQFVSTTGTSQVSVSPGQVLEGVNLTLLPKITDSGISLSVMPSVTILKQIREIESLGSTIEAPELSSRTLNTTVKIRSGDILVIGGLIYEKKDTSDQRTPGISNIPLIGWLFKQKTKTTTRTELVILLSVEEIS